jgi:hypothetical protein
MVGLVFHIDLWMRLSTSPWTSAYLPRNCHHFLIHISNAEFTSNWSTIQWAGGPASTSDDYRLRTGAPLLLKTTDQEEVTSPMSSVCRTGAKCWLTVDQEHHQPQMPHRHGCSWYTPSPGTSTETLNVCSWRRCERDMVGSSSSTREM